MKILLAHPDRDFLSAMNRLLEERGNTVITVFDAVMLVDLVYSTDFDIVVMDYYLPRMDRDTTIRIIAEREIPTVILTSENVFSILVKDKYLANAYLTYPLSCDRIVDTVQRVICFKSSDVTYEFGDVTVEANKFTLCNTLPLTEREIRLFSSLCVGDTPVEDNSGDLTDSLNYKFNLLKRKTRIKYIQNGYRLVMQND